MSTAQLVVFRLEREEYGVPIEHVREITRLTEVRSVPDAPNYIKGLINLRGQAVPVVNLHQRFGCEPSGNDCELKDDGSENAFALITEFEGNLIGLGVDQVQEVRTVENIDPPPTMIKVPFITGIINLPDRIIMLLDLEMMLRESGLEELSINEEG
ncbi:MAG TPA: chemotaxis protein CheW [Desulfobacteria bacterium]|nr:chemotaxis protein CheW [Desulfobacteria bacterium]